MTSILLWKKSFLSLKLKVSFWGNSKFLYSAKSAFKLSEVQLDWHVHCAHHKRKFHRRREISLDVKFSHQSLALFFLSPLWPEQHVFSWLRVANNPQKIVVTGICGTFLTRNFSLNNTAEEKYHMKEPIKYGLLIALASCDTATVTGVFDSYSAKNDLILATTTYKILRRKKLARTDPDAEKCQLVASGQNYFMPRNVSFPPWRKASIS